MGEFLKVVNYSQAIERLKECFPLREVEILSIDKAYKRVLAEDIFSTEDMPSFNRSTVDGYALAAADTFGSSEALPAYLQWKGEVFMGSSPEFVIGKGQCAWIPTGGMLPEGCDAVVMVEFTEKLGKDIVLIYRPAGPGENVMLKGEDSCKNQLLFQSGKMLQPHDIGFLASLGITAVPVYKPYSVGIISTGDEVVPVNIQPQPGQIRDINSHALAAAVQAGGNTARVYPLIRDDFQKLREAVEKGLQENELLLISGGSSVGIMDVTLEVLLDFAGAQLLFHGIAVKPGKPTLAVSIDKKVVIGLPGHPVSALMMYHVTCSPLLHLSPRVELLVKVTQNIASQSGRDDFIPVQLITCNNEKYARPLLGKSGLMSILSRADAYIHIPDIKQGLKAHESCTAYIF